MDYNLLLSLCTLMLIILDLANGSPFKEAPVSFWHIPIFRWANPCFLAHEDVSVSFVHFLPLIWNQPLFQGALVPFSGKRCLETSLGTGVVIAVITFAVIALPGFLVNRTREYVYIYIYFWIYRCKYIFIQNYTYIYIYVHMTKKHKFAASTEFILLFPFPCLYLLLKQWQTWCLLFPQGNSDIPF